MCSNRLQIEIPEGWQPISEKEINHSKSATAASLEYISEEEIATTIHGFAKDETNRFFITAKPYSPEEDGNYFKNNKISNEIIYEVLKNQGIVADTSSGTETIAGIEFSVFKTTIYSNDGVPTLYQTMYSTYFKGHDFSFLMSYNRKKHEDTILKALNKATIKD